MKGSWKRKSMETSKSIFQSETHPNFTLTFARAFLVVVGVDKDSYSYYWDKDTGSLTLLQEAKKEDTLTIDVLRTDSTSVKPAQSIKVSKSFVERENQVLR